METIKHFYLYNIANDLIEKININYEILLKPLIDKLCEKSNLKNKEKIKTLSSFFVEINKLLDEEILEEEQITEIINELRDNIRKLFNVVIQYRKYESDRIQDYFNYKFFIYDISFISNIKHKIPQYLISRIDIFEIEQKYSNQLIGLFWNDSLEQKAIQYFDSHFTSPNIDSEFVQFNKNEFDIVDFLNYLKTKDIYIEKRIVSFIDGNIFRQESVLFKELYAWGKMDKLKEIKEFKFISNYKISQELFDLISKQKSLVFSNKSKSYKFFYIYFSPLKEEKEILNDNDISKMDYIKDFLVQKSAPMLRKPIELKESTYKVEKRVYIQKDIYENKSKNNLSIINQENIDNKSAINADKIQILTRESSINPRISKNINLYLKDKYKKNVKFIFVDELLSLINKEYSNKLGISLSIEEIHSFLINNGYEKWNELIYINRNNYEDFSEWFQSCIINYANEHKDKFSNWKNFYRLKINELNLANIKDFNSFQLFISDKQTNIQCFSSGLIFYNNVPLNEWLVNQFESNNILSREEQIKFLEEITDFDIVEIENYFNDFLFVAHNYKKTMNFEFETESLVKNQTSDQSMDFAHVNSDFVYKNTDNLINLSHNYKTDNASFDFINSKMIDTNVLSEIYDVINKQNKAFVTKNFLKRVLQNMRLSFSIEDVLYSLQKSHNHINIWKLKNDLIISLNSETRDFSSFIYWCSSKLLSNKKNIYLDDFINAIKNYQYFESTPSEIINFISNFDFSNSGIMYDDYEEELQLT